jgi:glycosyltransferase involved in cell wall biosynthesis
MPALSKTLTVSVVIPTLNSGNVLAICLKSIRSQKFNQSKIEIIIADGGSTDDTLTIAKKYKCKTINNPLKTAESGKAVGIKHATNQFVALIDSDNILPNQYWLSKMLLPFSDETIIGSEPWEYTYRLHGGFVERYSALTGVNDPYALVANNYDRKNYLRNTWNGLNIKVKNYKNFQTFSLSKNDKIPSIGANGTIYRKSIIDKYFTGDYLIDVDFITEILSKSTTISFAKVKCSIVHTYCESSIFKFIKKQNRRVVDIYIYQNIRPLALVKSHLWGNIKFTLYVILAIPMLWDTLVGFVKKPDIAWFFHPLACVLTLMIYTKNTIYFKLGFLKPINRKLWSQ